MKFLTSTYAQTSTPLNVSNLIYVDGPSKAINTRMPSYFFIIKDNVPVSAKATYKLLMSHPTAGTYTRLISLQIMTDPWYKLHAMYEPTEINSQRTFQLFYQTVYMYYTPASWTITLTKV